MKFLYDTAILLYSAAIAVMSLFNRKAKQLYEGRRRSSGIINGYRRPEGKTVWFHAASLGEFEQGRPVMEALKKKDPSIRIILTFFSPSGYEIRKNYSGADVILYLPADTKGNVEKFLDAFRPDAAVIIKYEYWYRFLTGLRGRGIPVYLISAIFLPSQPFFKWWGGLYREMLGCFKKIFVQDESSLELLKGIGIKHAVVTGDTRFDRVCQIAEEAAAIPTVERFAAGAAAVVCGSTWQPDEENIMQFINSSSDGIKWIIAPHETDETHINRIAASCKKRTARFTSAPEDIDKYDVLIIDCIGLLSSVYRYGKIAYIGGGFGVGIHNTLEAAVYGIPVIFGPNHKRFREALDLLESGGAFTYSRPEELCDLFHTLTEKTDIAAAAGAAALKYVKSKLGATDLILKEIA